MEVNITIILAIILILLAVQSYLSTNDVTELGLKPCDGFVKLQLTIAMAHGVTMSLCGENYTGLLDQVLAEMFHTNLLEM